MLRQKFARIVDSATDTELVHLTLQDLMQHRGTYYRFNPYLQEFPELDEIRPKKFAMMKESTRMYLRRNQRKINDASYQLTKSKLPHHHLMNYLNDRREILRAQLL